MCCLLSQANPSLSTFNGRTVKFSPFDFIFIFIHNVINLNNIQEQYFMTDQDMAGNSKKSSDKSFLSSSSLRQDL